MLNDACAQHCNYTQCVGLYSISIAFAFRYVFVFYTFYSLGLHRIFVTVYSRKQNKLEAIQRWSAICRV